MSRHGIDTVKQAQKAERAIERCRTQIDLAIIALEDAAITVDSPTFDKCVSELRNGVADAFHDSSLSTFRVDCRHAVADWDGEEEFWRRFDLTCRVTV